MGARIEKSASFWLQQTSSIIMVTHLFTLKQTIPSNQCHPNVVSRQLLDLLLCNMKAQPRTIGHLKKSFCFVFTSETNIKQKCASKEDGDKANLRARQN